MSEEQVKEVIERIGYQEFYRYYEDKDVLIRLQKKEIERLNNIINELEEYLQNEIHNGRSEDNVWLMGCYDEARESLDKLHELIGSDKE